MKITKSQLRRIIQEELQYVLYEQTAPISDDVPQSDPNSPLYNAVAGKETHSLPATLVQPRPKAQFDRIYSGMPGDKTSGQQVADYQRQNTIDQLVRLSGEDDSPNRQKYVQQAVSRLGGTTAGIDPMVLQTLADGGIALDGANAARLAQAGQTRVAVPAPAAVASAAPVAAPTATAQKFDPNDRRSINAARKSGAINQDEWRTARRALHRRRRRA
tara:strand:- start:234 stop:881 length:648 start_codon:yes stop_codon:yes gene_type:complete